MTLGEIIRKFRSENNISQAEFAKKSGISKAYICMLENNRNPDSGKPIAPTYTTFQKVAAVTGFSTDDLIRAMDDRQMISVNLAADALNINRSELMKGLEDSRTHIANLSGFSFDKEPIEVLKKEPVPITWNELSKEEQAFIAWLRSLPPEKKQEVLNFPNIL